MPTSVPLHLLHFLAYFSHSHCLSNYFISYSAQLCNSTHPYSSLVLSPLHMSRSCTDNSLVQFLQIAFDWHSRPTRNPVFWYPDRESASSGRSYGGTAMVKIGHLQPVLRRTRHLNSKAYNTTHTSKDCYKYSFFLRKIKYWNSLPDKIATIKEPHKFKLALTHFD